MIIEMGGDIGNAGMVLVFAYLIVVVFSLNSLAIAIIYEGWSQSSQAITRSEIECRELRALISSQKERQVLTADFIDHDKPFAWKSILRRACRLHNACTWAWSVSWSGQKRVRIAFRDASADAGEKLKELSARTTTELAEFTELTLDSIQRARGMSCSSDSNFTGSNSVKSHGSG